MQRSQLQRSFCYCVSRALPSILHGNSDSSADESSDSKPVSSSKCIANSRPKRCALGRTDTVANSFSECGTVGCTNNSPVCWTHRYSKQRTHSCSNCRTFGSTVSGTDRCSHLGVQWYPRRPSMQWRQLFRSVCHCLPGTLSCFLYRHSNGGSYKGTDDDADRITHRHADDCAKCCAHGWSHQRTDIHTNSDSKCFSYTCSYRYTHHNTNRSPDRFADGHT